MNYRLLVMSLSGIISLKCAAQNTFSVGAKLGLGGSIVPLHATLETPERTGHVQAGTTFIKGILGQYMIGDRIGIESGVCLVHYSYYWPDESTLWRNRIWKGSASLEISDYQLPIILHYKIHFPSRFHKYLSLAAGTSLEGLTTGGTALAWIVPVVGLIDSKKISSLQNLHGSIRAGRERMSGRRLEYGLEFQYSFKSFYLKGTDYNQVDTRISSRLSLLAFNLYYFFWKKEFTKSG